MKVCRKNNIYIYKEIKEKGLKDRRHQQRNKNEQVEILKLSTVKKVFKPVNGYTTRMETKEGW